MPPPKRKEDSFAAFDPLLTAAGEESPWIEKRYAPNLDLLEKLLTIPVAQGDKQESGRPAKALDAWIAHELRRAGFPGSAVWPRLRQPRVLNADLSTLETQIEVLSDQLARHEQETGTTLKPRELRRAIQDVVGTKLGTREAYILGDFYAKQVDVGLATLRRGPDILISTKTMFSSYRKNLKNRHEEAVGEISSLRRRHPMAAMGFVFLARSDIYGEEGAYAILNDILTRLRRPEVTFDATLLLIAKWDEHAARPVVELEQPDPSLDASEFFKTIVNTVTERSPYEEHTEVRLRRDGAPPGGLPELLDDPDPEPEDS